MESVRKCKMTSKKIVFVSTCLGNNLLSYIVLQDYITDLYQFLGLSVGAEFSPEDVTLLYRKVFHLPSCTDEARAAMQKVTQIFLSRSINQKTSSDLHLSFGNAVCLL